VSRATVLTLYAVLVLIWSSTWVAVSLWIAFIKDFQDGYTGWVYAVRPSGQGLRVLIRVPGDLNFDDLAWQRLR
jgi:hypothetical protein